MRLAQVVEDVDGHMAKAKMDYYQKCAPAPSPRSPSAELLAGRCPGPSPQRARPPGCSRPPSRLQKPGEPTAVLAEGPPETPDHCVHGWQSRARHARPYAPPQLNGRS